MKREEAIKIVKSHYPANKQMLNEALEFLIPELTENEDEKIVNEIISYLNNRVATSEETELLYFKRWIAWLEKQDKIDKASYEVAEKEKYDFVSEKFIKCIKSFDVFKEDNSYWLEYVGNDTYIGRSDNILNQKFHITPRQLYSLFVQEHCPKEDNANAPTGYGKYVDECLNEASEHFFSEGEDKYSVADLFYAGVRCGKSLYENQKPVACNGVDSSEDEKIRKGLIKGLSAMRDIHHRQTFSDDVISINDAIDWLEKQGEKMKAKSEVIKDYTGEENVWNNARDFRPKHMQRCLCYDKYMGGVYCYVYDDISKYWCTQTTEEHDPDGDNHICDYADYRVTVWMCLPKTTFYPKKQDEQKPDWSEEDEEMIDNIIDYMKPMPIFFESTNGKSGKEYTREFVKNAIKWLKSIKNMVQPQHKEWSEEDEKMYKVALSCIVTLEDINNGKNRYADIKEWLKSFKDRVQPQHKEWSDEDEAYKEFAISAVEDYYDEENPLQKELVGWLKSFKDRLNWKPSKEQMETLEHYMHTLLATEHKEVLFGLYDDLKKL